MPKKLKVRFKTVFECEKSTLAVMAGSSSDKACLMISREAKLPASALDDFCSKKEVLK